MRVEGWPIKVRGRHVSYCRFSDSPRSGLDLDLQDRTVDQYLARGKARLIGRFVEHERGAGSDRPELLRAIQFCLENEARLLIAKKGRLKRDLGFLELLVDSRVRVSFADDPGTNGVLKFNMLANERDRRARVSRHVRRALVGAKERGVKLGGDRGNLDDLRLGPAVSAASRQERARNRAQWIIRYIEELRRNGATSLRAIAVGLDENYIRPPRGGKWSAAQVRAVIRWTESD